MCLNTQIWEEGQKRSKVKVSHQYQVCINSLDEENHEEEGKDFLRLWYQH